MNLSFLDFEQPIAEIQAKIEELRLVGIDSEINIADEISKLERKSEGLTETIFSSLTDWQITQLARHPQRPHSKDYIEGIFSDFDELHGDRHFSDDLSVMGGIARLEDQAVLIIGQQKGRDTKENLRHNFGMMHPEGFRKALRLMKLAEKFKLPVITLLDTPGAYPGIGAEERNQSEAIARNLFEMSRLKTPIVCIVTGEGCSGGALGIGVGDQVLMLEYSYYSVISPEGCASILWKSAEKAKEAAETLGITASKLKALNLIDKIIPEPLGGAHRDVSLMMKTTKDVLKDTLMHLQSMPLDNLLKERYRRLMSIGV